VRKVRITDSLAYHVYRSARLLRRHFLSMATSLDMELTQEQWFVLNKLVLEDGRSQVDLGEEIFADRPNLTRILTTMERRGLVRRRPDEEDGRRIRVFLTADGRRHHDEFAAIVPKARSQLFAGITKEDLETAIRVLARLESNLVKDD
jgi:DNA-binding MarR family transcriptional regulator